MGCEAEGRRRRRRLWRGRYTKQSRGEDAQEVPFRPRARHCPHSEPAATSDINDKAFDEEWYLEALACYRSRKQALYDMPIIQMDAFTYCARPG